MVASEIEYHEREGVRFALVHGTMTRTQHVYAQEVLNRALAPLELASLSDPYVQLFEVGGYRLDVQMPGPTRAVLVDEGPPFLRWEWTDNEFAWMAFDIDEGLPFNPSTSISVRLVDIDGRAFQASFATDESTRRYSARLEGFLRERVRLMVHIMATSPERRDQIIAGMASMRVTGSPHETA